MIAPLVMFALGGCKGCTRNNAPVNDNLPLSISVSAENIQVDFATDELLGQYESFHEFIHRENGAGFLIRIDKPVRDFEYIRLGVELAEEASVFVYFIDYVLYSIDELTPEKPFFIKTFIHVGALPGYAIAFTDASNTRRHFSIDENMACEGPQFIIRELRLSQNSPKAEAQRCMP